MAKDKLHPCPDCGKLVQGKYCHRHQRRPTEKRLQRIADIESRLGITDLRLYLIEAYKTKTIRQIARELEIHHSALRQWFHKFQIPIRSRSDTNRLIGSHESFFRPGVQVKKRLALQRFFAEMTSAERSAWAKRAGLASYQKRNEQGHQSALEIELYQLLDHYQIPYQPQYPIW